MKRVACWLVGAVVAASGVDAQTVYRCGPSGTVYSQSPCTDGRSVDVSDTRTSDQRAQAQQAVRTDAVTAASLERERRARDAAQVHAADLSPSKHPAAVIAKPVAHPKTHPRHASTAQRPADGAMPDGDFRAVAPQPPRPPKQPKAARAKAQSPRPGTPAPP